MSIGRGLGAKVLKAMRRPGLLFQESGGGGTAGTFEQIGSEVSVVCGDEGGHSERLSSFCGSREWPEPEQWSRESSGGTGPQKKGFVRYLCL